MGRTLTATCTAEDTLGLGVRDDDETVEDETVDDALVIVVNAVLLDDLVEEMEVLGWSFSSSCVAVIVCSALLWIGWLKIAAVYSLMLFLLFGIFNT